jgi:hypothetical protein
MREMNFRWAATVEGKRGICKDLNPSQLHALMSHKSLTLLQPILEKACPSLVAPRPSGRLLAFRIEGSQIGAASKFR